MSISEQIANALEGRKTTNGWIALCPAHDDHKPSLSISETSDGKPLVKCHAGCPQDSVIKELKNRNLWFFANTEKQISAEQKTGKNIDLCNKIWNESLQLNDPDSHPVQNYLKARGLEIKPAINDVIRCHPKLDYFENRIFKKTFPALLAKVTDSDGLMIGLHRIYLTPEGHKADVIEVKKSLGEIKGGTILFDQPRKMVNIAEGIETALAIRQATNGPTLSALSATNLEVISIPPEIGTVHIWADRDLSGAGAKAAQTLAGNLMAKGKFVFIHLPPTQIPLGKTSIDWLDELVNHGSEIIKSAYKNEADKVPRTANSFGPKLMSLKFLFEQPEEEYSFVVDGLLISGGLSIMTAKPKIGKSTWSRQLAQAIADGDDFLGRNTRQGEVLYLALEEKTCEVTKHFRDMGATGDEKIHVHIGKAPEKPLKWLESLIREFEPALVIIDPLFRFIKVSDANNYTEVTEALEGILNIARSSKSHILCVHHSRKGEGDHGDTILGSTAILGGVDAALYLKMNGENRVLTTSLRYGEDFDGVILNFDPVTRTMTLSDLKLEDSQDERICGEIIQFLFQAASPREEQEIKNGVTAKTGPFRKALRKLVQDSKIKRLGEGTRGNPFLYSL